MKINFDQYSSVIDKRMEMFLEIRKSNENKKRKIDHFLLLIMFENLSLNH